MAKYSASERIFLDDEVARISNKIAEEVDQKIFGCAIKEVDGLDGIYLGYDMAHGLCTTVIMRVVNAGTKDKYLDVVDIIQHGKYYCGCDIAHG